MGPAPCSLCGPAQPLATLTPPAPRPALPEPLHLLFLLHILSLCPFLNSVPLPGSAGTLLFLQLQGANSQREGKAFLRRRGPDALSHHQPSPKGQSFLGSAGTVAMVSPDQLQGLPEGPSLTSWLSDTANSPLRAGDTLGWLWAGKSPRPG